MVAAWLRYVFRLKIRVLIFLNGQFVPEERAVVSVFDRGFLYGDGVFEGVRIFNGKPFRWEAHLKRFKRGAKFLGIKIPFPEKALRKFAGELVAKNKMPDAILRMTLSRGVGVRGYSPQGAKRPTLVMSLHPAPTFNLETPPRWKLITASFCLPANEPLSQFKTCNKLPQILARAEADAAGADEALLLNTEDHVVEATSGNLFWIHDGVVCTPPLASGILPGVTREVVFEICERLGLPFRETNVHLKNLLKAQGVFLSLTSWGIVEAASLNGRILRGPPSIGKMRVAYLKMMCEKNVKSR